MGYRPSHSYRDCRRRHWGGLVGISVAAVLALVVSLGEIAWQLFKDARWVIRRIRKRPPDS